MRSVVLGFALAAVACGSGSSSGSGADGGGALLPDGGRAPAGTEATGPLGSVSVFQSTSSGGGSTEYEISVAASFTDGATIEDANDCASRTEAGCKISICAKTDGGLPPQSHRSAGNIIVSGIAAPAQLSPKSDKSYETYTATSTGTPYLPPGATIVFSASGADVPAFRHEVVAGGALTVTTPSFNLMMTTLPKGDVPIAWSGAAASDTVQVMLQANATSDGSKNAIVTCDFHGSSGAVPKSVMDVLAGTGSILIGTLNRKEVSAGAYRVSLNVLRPEAAGVYNR